MRLVGIRSAVRGKGKVETTDEESRTKSAISSKHTDRVFFNTGCAFPFLYWPNVPCILVFLQMPSL